jgi:hypothetical protein
MSRNGSAKFAAIVVVLCAAALVLAAIAGAKTSKLTLKGVVTKVIPPIKVGNGPRTISTLYEGTKKVGKINFSSDCATNECVEGGYAHIKGFKLTGEKSGTLYADLVDKLHGIPPKSSGPAKGTLCIAQRGSPTSGCVTATLTPPDIGTVGTHFTLVVG